MNRTLLLVEDNPGDAYLLREYLSEKTISRQYEITTASLLGEALRLLEAQAFDVILLDLNLADSYGLPTISTIMTATTTPVIVITELDDTALGIEAVRAGAQDYLVKGKLETDVIIRSIRYALERAVIRKELSDRETDYRLLAENITDLIVRHAPDSTIRYASPSCFTLLGYTPEEMVGSKADSFFPPDDLYILNEIRTHSRKIIDTYTITYRARHKDGTYRWFETRGSVIRDSLTKRVRETVCISRDITKRKRAEQRLVEERTLLRTLIDNLPDLIYIKDSQSRIIISNQAQASLLGVATPDEALGKTDFDFFPRQEAELFFADEQAVLKNGSALLNREETVTDQATGPQRWLSTSKVPLRDSSGEIIGIVGIGRDITQGKLANEALQWYSRRVALLHQIDRAILTAQPPAFVAEMITNGLVEATHCDGVRIIKVDPFGHAFSYLAATPPVDQQSKDLLRQTIEQYGVPDVLRQGKGQLINDIRTHAEIWPGYEEVLTRHNIRSWMIIPMIAVEGLVGLIAVGSVRPLAFTSEHFEIAQEVANQLAIALHRAHLDEQIQEHTRTLEVRVAERTEQLRLAKERTEAILMSTLDAICVARMDGRIEQVNPAFTALFGDAPGQNQRLSLFSLIDGASTDVLKDALQAMIAKAKIARVELVCLRGDGSNFHADVALAQLEAEEPPAVICSIRDVSLYRHAEDSLRAALAHQKELNELQASFTSIVSHEFRTPLSVILSSTEILLKYSERMDQNRRQDKLINITQQITRLIHLLDDVLMFTRAESKGFEFNPTPVRLVALCKETIEDAMAGRKKEVHIDFVHQGDCQLVNVDEFLFSHILQNLATNAVKYSNYGGTVYISLICSSTSVTLRVEDQGIGIPEEHQAKLFEAFRRASNVGQIQGTGIGLTIVKRAVEAHGGTIEFESTEGVGTTFIVNLPVAASAAGEDNQRQN